MVLMRVTSSSFHCWRFDNTKQERAFRSASPSLSPPQSSPNATCQLRRLYSRTLAPLLRKSAMASLQKSFALLLPRQAMRRQTHGWYPVLFRAIFRSLLIIVKPTSVYEEADLGDLEPGPRNLTLMGRVVNFYDTAKPSKSHKAAQGCLKIMLADDTGVLTVRLWYANTAYKLRLGHLVTVWTVHVSNNSEYNSLAPSTAPLFTSIFPEGERNCHFMIHENSDDGTRFKRPFDCRDSRSLPGLMTLKSFADGGYDVDEPKLLVCVKSIGARKRCPFLSITSRNTLMRGVKISTEMAPFPSSSPWASSTTRPRHHSHCTAASANRQPHSCRPKPSCSFPFLAGASTG